MREWTRNTIGSCEPCGKVNYASRKAARRAGRDFHPGQHIAAYACPSGPFWHLGNLTPGVICGRVSRGQAYKRAS
ncbi:hypothetical protein [Actinoplanes rectilineatus]|uniref:hypothetical protein n=1 Tax=Actinoplanes rectilineatus TaxID=113571 RepID=UPI0005F2DE8A|nr:hypothetical protein [Actinoplanes rectilineatus]